MSKLTKVDSYAILWLAHSGMDVAGISKELKLPEKSIINLLEKQNGTNETNNVKTGSEPVGKTRPKTLMINETASKKKKSVSVMTEAASQKNDEIIKNINRTHNDKNIFRPYNG